MSGLLINCDEAIMNQRHVHGKLYQVGKSVDNSTLGKRRFTEPEKKKFDLDRLGDSGLKTFNLFYFLFN
jgi:hypothetical protein